MGSGLGSPATTPGTLIGFPIIASSHRAPVGRGQWLSTRLAEPVTWRETAHLIIGLALGVLTLTVLTFEVVAVGSTFSAIISGDVVPAPAAVAILAVLVELIAIGYLNTVFAAGQALLAQVLLSPGDQQLAEEVQSLRTSREILIDASAAERRRIERDLHDGVQQQLVSLSMALGMIELETADSGNTAVRTAVIDAQTRAEAALSELRRTVRGLHPQVLLDHGLDEAIGELASHQPIPVDARSTIGRRLDERVELAAYFVVSEALTNAIRHSSADRVTLRAALDGDRVRIVVADDGAGGADPARGSGLRGLQERATALGGELTIDSSTTAGTTLTLTLPASRGPMPVGSAR